MMEVETFNPVYSKGSLVEMNTDFFIRVTPRELDAQEPFNLTHEIHVDELREDALKVGLNGITYKKSEKKLST